MSGLGHSRRFDRRPVTSGLPRKQTCRAATEMSQSAITGPHALQQAAFLYSITSARRALLLGVGESRFEHFADRLPRAAIELN
jgi:hypothetical protein